MTSRAYSAAGEATSALPTAENALVTNFATLLWQLIRTILLDYTIQFTRCLLRFDGVLFPSM